ncbi:MAG: hypothetical protein AAF500_09195 [Myxococcota bacterium]
MQRWWMSFVVAWSALVPAAHAPAQEPDVVVAPPDAPPPPRVERGPTPPVVETGAPPGEAAVKAEDEEPIGRLRVGGGLGLGFGTDITFVSVAPQVSYLIRRIVEPGVAFLYQYTRDRFPIEDVIWHTYGGSLFARIYPISSLFFVVEGELLNAGFRQAGFNSGRTNYWNLFLGGGYGLGVGRGVFMVFSIKVNVFRTDLYPSNFPIFSFGVGYTF